MPKNMSVLAILLAIALAGCSTEVRGFSYEGGPGMGELDPGHGPTRNRAASFNMVDYDTLQGTREIRDSEIQSAIDKWNLGINNTFWENYRGNNVRVEVLRNNRDLKEMRLKFVQSHNMHSNPDGTISEMLDNVAGKVMKSTCGRRARQAIVLYERPSVELVKETTYDYYKIIARGNSIKEYGFRCIY